MLTFSREQQLASSDSRITGPSSEFIPRIDAHPPKALSILVGLAVLEVQGSPKCTWECIVPVMRPSLAFEHWDIALNSLHFKLQTQPFIFLTSTLGLAWGALWCGKEKRSSHSHCSSSNAPAAFDSVPVLLTPQAPIPAQLWLSHTLVKGHFHEKYKSTFKTTSNQNNS